MIGFDPAEHVFQVHGIDQAERVVVGSNFGGSGCLLSRVAVVPGWAWKLVPRRITGVRADAARPRGSPMGEGCEGGVILLGF